MIITYRPAEIGDKVTVKATHHWFDHANLRWTEGPIEGRLEAYVGPTIHVRTDDGRLYKGTPYDIV
jgi:hypothetical protein